jgi:hypothetical protein
VSLNRARTLIDGLEGRGPEPYLSAAPDRRACVIDLLINVVVVVSLPTSPPQSLKQLVSDLEHQLSAAEGV